MTDSGSGSASTTRPVLPALRLVPVGDAVGTSSGGVQSMAWGRNGDRLFLAIGDTAGNVHLREAAGDTLLPRRSFHAAHEGAVRSVAWARDGVRLLLATGGDDRQVRLWQVVDNALHPLGGAAVVTHTATVRSVAWMRDDRGLLLTSADDDGAVDLCHLAGDRPVTRGYFTGSVAVRSVGWARDYGHPLLAVGHGDGDVYLWHAAPEQPAALRSVARTGAEVRSLAWTWDVEQLFLAVGNAEGTVSLWEAAGDALLPVSGPGVAHPGGVRSVAWAHHGDRQLLATSGEDGAVRLWELGGESLILLGEPGIAHFGAVTSVAWASYGEGLLLASGDDGGAVRLWEVVEDRAVPRLPAYRSDALGLADALARSDDARALAELVTARSARPPLAVGLFGDWGEGKSHFLGLLQREVGLVARAGNPLAHRDVRQVRFNAWHYAETGLWASLVAELFAQLAAPPGDDDPGEAQRSMSRLTAELVTARGLRPRLDAARARRDQLQRALGERDLWDRLPPDEQRQITDLAGADAAPARLYRQAAGGASVAREHLAMLRATLRGLGPVRVAGFAAGCAAVAAGSVAAARVWEWLPGWAGGLPGAVPLVAGAAWLTGQVSRTRARLQGAWQAARRIAERQRSKLLTAAEVAAAEVAALERQMQDLTAAGQLAGLVGDRATSGDYRGQLGVMTQIREDFQRMAGLLARAASSDEGAGAGGRSDGDGGRAGRGSGPGTRGPDQAAAPGGDSAGAPSGGGAGRSGRSGGGRDRRDESGVRDEADDLLPRIDRIIIYVDDLDRCPPARVVEMLEAIHLLLAVELFVVVVAIDPRWLLRAIAAHYRDVLDDAPGGGRELGASTPAQYLEKIFQVVLTLPALDAGGYARMIDTLVGVRDDREPRSFRPRDPAAPPPARATGAGARTPAGVVGPVLGALVRGRGNGNEGHETPSIPRADTVRVVERTDPLTLEPDELALLRLLGPPHLVATPRGVTRLANSYGLLTALRRTHREADLAQTAASGAPPYRAGMVLLAALVAYPALGPALCLHLHAEATARPDTAWRDFCAALPPPSAPADPQWEALRTALLAVTQTAADHALLLPMPLAAWCEWVLPVARLSFPAGSIVPTLHPGRGPG